MENNITYTDKVINAIGNEIISVQEIPNPSTAEKEYLNTLNMCYDLIANTDLMLNLPSNYTQLGEMAEEHLGESPTDIIYRHGPSSSPLADYIKILMKGQEAKDFILQVRNKMNKTQYAFAKLTGCTHSQIRQWELGQNKPGVENLLKIIEAVKNKL